MRIIQNRFLRNISANSFQLVVNQVFGLLIFYTLSRGLDKNSFGQLNWSLAVLLMVFGMLSFGIDQVMVKKIAAGEDRQSIFTAYFFHVLSGGIIFYGLLLGLYFIFSRSFQGLHFLLFLAAGKLFIFWTTPFKQLATGLEKFPVLFRMSVVSNIIRGMGLLVLLIAGKMNTGNVIVLFIAGDFLELLACIAIGRPLLQPAFKLKWNKTQHLMLIRESLPQAGVVLFSAIMARFDWILIGLLISSSKLAEYSFAWKMYEVSILPLLIISPIMVPMFTRLLKEKAHSEAPLFFLEWQIIIASFIALGFNICWVPVVDLISNGKYGMVNVTTVFILSLCMPLLYFNNYLWTINFTKGKLKRVFYIMAASFVVNIIGCGVLIPLYKNEGAAAAYLLTLVTQFILYMRVTPIIIPAPRKYRLLLWPLAAFICGFMVTRYVAVAPLSIALSLLIFIMVTFLSKQFNGKNWKVLQSLYQ